MKNALLGMAILVIIFSRCAENPENPLFPGETTINVVITVLNKVSDLDYGLAFTLRIEDGDDTYDFEGFLVSQKITFEKVPEKFVDKKCQLIYNGKSSGKQNLAKELDWVIQKP